MTDLPTLFATILHGLRTVVATQARRNHAQAPVLELACTRIGRMAARFAALFARWRAGTLREPRPSRPRPARPASAQQLPRLPRARLWLTGMVGYEAAGRGCQIEHLLTQPDMQEFLTAVPRTGRILRPLCQMLGVPLPPVLRLPPRPPRPRMPLPRIRRPRASVPMAPPPLQPIPATPSPRGPWRNFARSI